MKKYWNFTVIVALAAVVGIGAGCSKPTEEEPPTAAPTATTKKVAPPPRVTKTTTPSPDSAAPENPAQPPMPATESENPAQQIATLENSYRTLSDFSAKVEAIYKISDIGTADSVVALGHLFQAEKDTDMRVEIVDSLFDIEGQDAQKVAILSAAAAADQKQEVRESAIDALTDIDPKHALPILEALISDPDEDIREAAKDALQIVKSVATGATAKPGQPQQ